MLAVQCSLLAGARGAQSSPCDLMLPAQYRMRSSSDFAATIKGGKRQRAATVMLYALSSQSSFSSDGDNSVHETQTFALECAHNTKAGQQLVGFVVSKKVGNSVARHRVVRQLREIIRPLLPFSHPVKIVVRALPLSASVPFITLRSDVTRALSKLDLLKDSKAAPALWQESSVPAVSRSQAGA